VSVLLVSLSAPELDRLAAELAARRSLLSMVRRYVNKGRHWERALARLPVMGGAYAATLGRRSPPAGLHGKFVHEAGVATDFAGAVVHRGARLLPNQAARANAALRLMTERAVARAAARLVERAEQVVASYHVALPAFQRARERGRTTLLNYPIAHHRWQYRFYAEQAERNPEFAAALPQFGDREQHAATLDAEIELADLVLVGSRFARDSFVSEGIAPDRIRVIPYGADVLRFQPSKEPARSSSFRVLFVGQIGERKGVSYLLKAYERFRRPDTELHLVGDYVAGAEVYRPYRHLYRHTPNIPQSQLPELFRSAEVLVFPTLVEGMGMVALEAMACGVPVIATPCGPDEVVRDGIDGFIVPPCDSDAIVDRLERLYGDEGLRRQMGSEARVQAERWSWTRYATSAADVVLGDRGATRGLS
jgi:glycosyltransferase involved in cell wall biosynthesis